MGLYWGEGRPLIQGGSEKGIEGAMMEEGVVVDVRVEKGKMGLGIRWNGR